MVEQGSRDDEIVGLLLDIIVKDVDAPDFKTMHAKIRDVCKVDLVRNDMVGRRNPLRHTLGYRSVTTADFKSSPTRLHSMPANTGALDRIKQRGHKHEALLFPRYGVGSV
jgi:hypothetical protein